MGYGRVFSVIALSSALATVFQCVEHGETANLSVSGSVVQAVTYNTGLTPRVPEYDVRRRHIGSALKRLDADIICLQEVWFQSDAEEILSSLGNTDYPYSISELHRDVGKLERVGALRAPCLTAEFLADFLPCITLHCGNTGSSVEYLRCTKHKCGMLHRLRQECITCLVLSGYDRIRQNCVENLGDRFNVPGLMLISRLPLKDVNVNRFINRTLFIPRAYIAAKVEGIGTVACTHSSADLGTDYFEALPHFTSWGEQALAESKLLVTSLRNDKSAVVLGDLNATPSIPATGVTSDFEVSLEYIGAHGYSPVYRNEVGICTWCSYNSLTHDNHNNILDHVYTRNICTVGARRILEEKVKGRDFPHSDHFGIEVSMLRGNGTCRWRMI